jgi:hypothetical protein
VAAVCAQALERARLYERERRFAETLQRALLPKALPSIDQFEFAVRYIPAAERVAARGRMHTLLNAGMGAGTVLGALVLAACGQNDEAPPDAGDNDTATAETLTLAISADESTLTPFTHKTGYPGANLVKLVFDTLVVVDPDFSVTPLLATEVRTDDNQVFDVPVREDVAWHDGEPFTAEDVAFTYEYFTEVHREGRYAHLCHACLRPSKPQSSRTLAILRIS